MNLHMDVSFHVPTVAPVNLATTDCCAFCPTNHNGTTYHCTTHIQLIEVIEGCLPKSPCLFYLLSLILLRGAIASNRPMKK